MFHVGGHDHLVHQHDGPTELDDAWALALDRMRGRFMERLRAADLTPPLAITLKLLHHDGPMPLRAVANHFNMDASAATWLADRLESRGLAVRDRSGRSPRQAADHHRRRTGDGRVAGTVVEVGANVTRFSPGDEVLGVGRGSFAEFAAAREDKLARKPVGTSFEQAAVVPVSAITALQGLRDAGRVEPGQHVLITGASGGVGTFAVQLAKAFGARVTGVCSTTKLDLVRLLGADDVVDYTQEDSPIAGTSTT